MKKKSRVSCLASAMLRLGGSKAVALMLVACTAAVGLWSSAPVEAANNEHRFIGALNPQWQEVLWSWAGHPPANSLDLVIPEYPGSSSAGTAVHSWSYRISAQRQGWAYLTNYGGAAPTQSKCTGVRLRLWGDNGTIWQNLNKEVSFVHLDNILYFEAEWGYMLEINGYNGDGWNGLYLGTVATSQPSGCNYQVTPTAHHVHEESINLEHNGGGANLNNGDVFDAWDPWANWLFKVTW